LLTFATLPPADLEETEGLEQLRILDYGYKIKLIESEIDSIGIDTQEDLDKVTKLMENKHA
jgi:3-deoxy-manno-octulosonate cytidylyltransferase (CMP-KDO synthetase)